MRLTEFQLQSPVQAPSTLELCVRFILQIKFCILIKKLFKVHEPLLEIATVNESVGRCAFKFISLQIA